MSLTTILKAIELLNPLEAFLFATIISYLVFKGIVQLPFIKKRKEKKNLKKGKGKLLPIHEHCINYPSLLSIIDRVVDRNERIFDIKYRETIYDQMVEAELLWSDFKEILSDNYLKILKEKNPDLDKKEITRLMGRYRLIIDAIQRESLGLIRKWMKKNHFLDKNDLEFENYIKEKSEMLNRTITNLFYHIYNDEIMLVEDSILRQSMLDNCYHTLLQKFHIFFFKVRRIAQEKQNKIEKIRKEIEEI